MLTYTDRARTLCGHFLDYCHTDIYMKYYRYILCILPSTTVQRVWYSYGWRRKGKTKNLSGTTSHLCKSLPARYDRSWKWGGGKHNAQSNFDFSHCTKHTIVLSLAHLKSSNSERVPSLLWKPILTVVPSWPGIICALTCPIDQRTLYRPVTAQ